MTFEAECPLCGDPLESPVWPGKACVECFAEHGYDADEVSAAVADAHLAERRAILAAQADAQPLTGSEPDERKLRRMTPDSKRAQ